MALDRWRIMRTMNFIVITGYFGPVPMIVKHSANPKVGAESDNRLIHTDRQYGQEPPSVKSTSGSRPEVFLTA